MSLADELRKLVAEAVAEEIRPLLREVTDLRAALERSLPERWVTRAEAARALRCSVDTIDRQVQTGDLESRRIGKRGVRVKLATRPSAETIAAMAAEARRR